VIRIELPPLRSRTEDVPDLLAHYLRQAANELGHGNQVARAHHARTPAGLSLARQRARTREPLPRLTALRAGSEIHLEDLPSEMHIVTPAAQTDWAAALTLWAKAQPHDGTVAWLDQALPEFERVLIRVALNRTHGHRQEAARVLGWGRNTLTASSRNSGWRTTSRCLVVSGTGSAVLTRDADSDNTWPRGQASDMRARGNETDSATVLEFPGFSSRLRLTGDITATSRDCCRESETPLFPVSRACSILCPIRVPDKILGPETERKHMQEIVVQATKYPEIVVQGQRYDYTSDIVLIVVGVVVAAAFIWRYSMARRGKD
jgi:hypothetical protein